MPKACCLASDNYFNTKHLHSKIWPVEGVGPSSSILNICQAASSSRHLKADAEENTCVSMLWQCTIENKEMDKATA